MWHETQAIVQKLQLIHLQSKGFNKSKKFEERIQKGGVLQTALCSYSQTYDLFQD